MHLLFEEVLRPNKYLMNTIGAWPLPPNTGFAFKCFTLVRIIVAIFFLLGVILSQIYHINVHRRNINIIADTGCLMIIFILVIFKFCYMTIRQRSFCTVYQRLREFWMVSNDQMERRSYEKLALMAKLVTIIAFTSASCNFVSFLGAALIPMALNRHEGNETTRLRLLPLDTSYGFDVQKSPNYELTFISQTLGMMFVAAGTIGCDSTMMTIVMHVSGQFRYIDARFEAIGSYVNDAISLNDDKVKVEVTEKISTCLAHHQLVIRVAKKVSELLSPMVFGQMVCASMQICLTGYTVIEGDNSMVDLFKFGAVFVTMLVQLFIWCWPGELLIQESNAVADSIWHNVPWYLLPAKQQRDLCFVILRAQKECHIATAFQVMSIQKLTEVLQVAVSYMALLRTMKDK